MIIDFVLIFVALAISIMIVGVCTAIVVRLLFLGEI